MKEASAIQSDKKPLIGFLILWTIVNVVQASFMDLGHDEAYYWTWSKHLDWSFLEHPPMVAVFIKIGYAILQNELGVRLMAILLSTLVLYLVYDKLVKKDVWLYIALVSSVALFHAGGFIIAPDTGLFVFVALFYILLKKYIEEDNWKLTIGLMVVSAAIMYSKYHGVLVLFFSLLFNWRLLRRKSLWIILVGSAILYIPHFHWLFTKGLPGLQYALSGRFYDAFSLNQILVNYIVGQLAVIGPLVSFILLYVLFFVRQQGTFERSLRFICIGIFGYFLIWSFKGRVEANWTASVLIPLVVLTHAYATERQKLRKVIFWLVIPSICIFLALRAQLAFRLVDLPNRVDRHGEYHGWKEYGQRIKALAGDMPIVSDGYHNPPKMWFYTGNTAISFCLRDHPNQYLLWDYNEQFLDKPVLVVSNILHTGDKMITQKKDSTEYKVYEEFRSYREVKLEPLFTQNIYKAGDTLQLGIKVIPPPKWSIRGADNTKNPVYLSCSISTKDKRILNNGYRSLVMEDISEETVVPFELPLPQQPGEYEFSFHLVAKDLIKWHTSEPLTLSISD